MRMTHPERHRPNPRNNPRPHRRPRFPDPRIGIRFIGRIPFGIFIASAFDAYFRRFAIKSSYIGRPTMSKNRAVRSASGHGNPPRQIL